jgi:hypothetical protein
VKLSSLPLCQSILISLETRSGWTCIDTVEFLARVGVVGTFARDFMNTVSAKWTLHEYNEGIKIFLPQFPVPSSQSPVPSPQFPVPIFKAGLFSQEQHIHSFYYYLIWTIKERYSLIIPKYKTQSYGYVIGKIF